MRIFNTYGPRMRLDDGRALPAFMAAALRGEDLPVFGAGKQTRSFCFVSDMVDGILRLLESNEHDPVNIGTEEEVTVLQLAKEVLELTGSKSKIAFQPLPEDDPKVRRPDIGRARALLKWEPRVKRAEGLKWTLEYFKQHVRPR